MPISSISTIFIHNHAPVLENAVILKTPENSTFPLFHIKMRYLSHDYASQSYSTVVEWIFSNCINRTSTVNTRVRVTYYMIFVKHPLHNSQHHFTYYQTSYNLILNILTSNTPHKIQSYSIQLYRYYNTVTIL